MHSFEHRQRGISLISLMIGLLISLLAVMGMMALYRTVMHTTAESGVYAQLAGDRSAALLVAHTYLQEAGFGVEDATLGDDLALCGASMSSGRLAASACTGGGSGNLLLWRASTHAAHCAGLHITDAGALEYLSPQSCAGGLLSGEWAPEQRRELYASAVPGAGFTALEIVSEPCQALGVAGEGAVQVRLQAQHPVAVDSGAQAESVPVVSTTCLVNFRGASG